MGRAGAAAHGQVWLGVGGARARVRSAVGRASHRRKRDGGLGAGQADRVPARRTPRVSSALVTGATGCLGGHLVDSLVSDAVHVRALTQVSSRTDYLEQLGVEVQRGSLVEQADLERAVEGVE